MKRILILLSILLLASPVFAASVNVSTVAVAGQTVTVTTATPHGLAINSGFCLSAPSNVCSVAETIPTSTTLTFTQPSNLVVPACASSCGTGIAAPHVFILTVSAPSQSVQSVSYGLWLTTTKPIPHPGTASAWTSGAGSTGPTTAQTNALVAGSFIERTSTQDFPAGYTITQMQAYLQTLWTSKQAEIANNTQPAAFYGSFWDGSAWSIQ